MTSSSVPCEPNLYILSQDTYYSYTNPCHINKKTWYRSIDWLVSLSVQFNLSYKCTHTAMNIFMRYACHCKLGLKKTIYAIFASMKIAEDVVSNEQNCVKFLERDVPLYEEVKKINVHVSHILCRRFTVHTFQSIVDTYTYTTENEKTFALFLCDVAFHNCYLARAPPTLLVKSAMHLVQIRFKRDMHMYETVMIHKFKLVSIFKHSKSIVLTLVDLPVDAKVFEKYSHVKYFHVGNQNFSKIFSYYLS